MRIVKISTTAWLKEDFLLLTDLTDEQIIKVIEPLVLAERENPDNEENYYDNDVLVAALNDAYPYTISDHYDIDNIDEITI